MMNTFSEKEEISKTDFDRPHCFLLGSGASLAAFPNGDKNGRELPVMANFIKILQLEPYLVKTGYEPPYDNFETIYAELSAKPEHEEVVSELEEVIYQYFEGMELPDEPTLYDHLILSLREKMLLRLLIGIHFCFKPP